MAFRVRVLFPLSIQWRVAGGNLSGQNGEQFHQSKLLLSAIKCLASLKMLPFSYIVK